ncbi:hypothetical protein C2845_PM03G31780 [Panicum miliaceum]|uniref:Uncharacterized protein n=1 Tax=Panicum miliaceum TaxID=4540 RepID=A0A3L6TE17_PANMI|nr:hypothetical protein C2845_PM03G31780 [Panicum miliaceum]
MADGTTASRTTMVCASLVWTRLTLPAARAAASRIYWCCNDFVDKQIVFLDEHTLEFSAMVALR